MKPTIVNHAYLTNYSIMKLMKYLKLLFNLFYMTASALLIVLFILVENHISPEDINEFLKWCEKNNKSATPRPVHHEVQVYADIEVYSGFSF